MAAGLAVAVVFVVVVECFIGVARRQTCASWIGLHPVVTTVNTIVHFFSWTVTLPVVGCYKNGVGHEPSDTAKKKINLNIRRHVARSRVTLTPREIKVLDRRFGLGFDEPTLARVRASAKAAEKRSLERLRARGMQS